jgi:hypothetical protein
MRVEWVHPSWRDLVIESLAADGEERRRFLSRCGVDGAAVALSWGGGAAGERERPLLRCDADWDALGDGLYALCPELEEAAAIQLLGVLDDAGAFDEVLALARLVLERLKWAGHALSVDAIAAWVPLAAKLSPPPEPPAVAMTWLELEPHELPRTPEALERFADWVRLAWLLWEHDPELLHGLDFPRKHYDILRAFAAELPGDEPPLERDLRLEALRRLAEMVRDLAPATTATAASLALPGDRFPDLEFILPEPEPPDSGFPVERVLRDL